MITADQIEQFMRNHFGVTVNDEELNQILGSPELIRTLNQSITSSRRGIQGAMSMDRGGYSHRDDYWKLPKRKKPVPGLAYDPEGRRMAHFEQFLEAANTIMGQSPTIVAIATRTGIEFNYNKNPKKDDTAITK